MNKLNTIKTKLEILNLKEELRIKRTKRLLLWVTPLCTVIGTVVAVVTLLSKIQ